MPLPADSDATARPPRVRVLGPIELTTANGEPRPIGSARLRRLLAVLAVNLGTVVSADRLTDVLWGTDQPANPDPALQTVVSRLRTQLAVVGLSDVLLTRNPGYLLRLERADLDATSVADSVESATVLITSNPVRSAALLDGALDLWRGAAYAEFADDDFCTTEMARLQELQATVIELRTETALALGRFDEAAALAERSIRAAELRERPRVQYMVALTCTGRTADALAAFREYRRLLADELGLEPSADMTALHDQILRQDGAVGADRLPTGGHRSVGNLPSALPTIIGRDDALEDLARSLDVHRLVCVTGPGGVGKTRLALSAGRRAEGNARHPQGVWIIELAPLRAGESVVDAVSTVLAVSPSAGLAAVDRLTDYLRAQRCLLILDNCEHLIDEVAELIRLVLDRCPDVTLLATSQVPLNLPVEASFPLLPLAIGSAGEPSPAVSLFLERTDRIVPGFAPSSSDLVEISELCRRLDGLPLAIELAAARMRVMTPAEVIDRLTDRFRLLRSADRFAEHRHRTLFDVVEWSYGLLGEDEQRLFDRLSVFRGGFGLADAAAVVGTSEPELIAPLEALVEHSMVRASAGSSRTTFSLLETLREFGARRLADSGESERVGRAHASTMLQLINAGSGAIEGPDPGPWVRAVGARFDDIRAAQSWALGNDLPVALELVVGLGDWIEFEVSAEVMGWARRAAGEAMSADLTDPTMRRLTVSALAIAAAGARFGGDLRGALSLAGQAADLIADPDDPVLRLPLYVQCEVRLYLGDLDQCLTLADRTQALAERAGDQLRVKWCVMNRSLAYAYGGRPAEGIAIAEALLAEPDLPAAIRAWARYAVGEVLMTTDPQRSLDLLEQAVQDGRDMCDRFLIGVASLSAVSLRARVGDPRAAVPLFADVVEHWHRLGNWTQRWTTFRSVAELLERLDDPEPSALLVGAATAESRPAQAYGSDAERLQQLGDRLNASLGSQRLTELTRTGASMSDDAVFQLVRTALDQHRTVGGVEPSH